jgi:hypothetical protein
MLFAAPIFDALLRCLFDDREIPSAAKQRCPPLETAALRQPHQFLDEKNLILQQ